METPKLTPSEKKFFKELRGQQAVMRFFGCAFAANNFINWALINNLIEQVGHSYIIKKAK